MVQRNTLLGLGFAGLLGALALISAPNAFAADEPKPAAPAADAVAAPAVATPAAPAAATPAAPAAAAAPVAEDPDLTSDDPGKVAAAKARAAAAQLAGRKITEVTGKKPAEVAAANPLGTMRNPYTDNAEKIEEGKKLYFSYSCNGCHGGGGGGGMCPALTNDIWVYGSDDDILFRLITLGSQDLQKTHSLKRKGSENVVGPMPAFAELVKTDDEMWKIITFIRSLYKGTRRAW
ncbi:MAG: c-type cytochrome [Hyphomicrobium sp.]|nr:c-type cytochrome [Hyphomicrobium sp.]